jgi:hypothetical protein
MTNDAAAGDASHDEWLLDESIEETFPASDPTSPVRPGSTLGLRNAAHDARADLAVADPHASNAAPAPPSVPDRDAWSCIPV